MAVTFKTAPTVAIGERIVSTQLNSLADAFNDRIKSGCGDCAWRIAFAYYGLFARPTQPADDPNATPQFDEWFKYWQFVDPETSSSTWPDNSSEEAKPGNPLVDFVLGRSPVGSEHDRLYDPLSNGTNSLPLRLNGNLPVTPRDFWILGALQRGGYDPVTTYQNAPALKAAQEHYRLTGSYSPRGVALKTYGGYLPTPAFGSFQACNDGGPFNEPDTPNYLPFYSPLPLNQPLVSVTKTYTHYAPDGTKSTVAPGGIVSYQGTCPSDPGVPGYSWDASRNVTFQWKGPFDYFVWLADGSLDVFALADWVAGPYTTAGTIQFDQGAGIDEMLNLFIKNFRGSTTERLLPGYIDHVQQFGFDNQEFFTRQYLLAPAFAADEGSGIAAIYPDFSTDVSTASGTYLTEQHSSSDNFTTHTGFVFAGFMAEAIGLVGTVTANVEVNGVTAATVSLTADVDGKASTLVWLTVPKTGMVRVKLTSALTLNGAGIFYVECAELLAYKPNIIDAYVVLRLSAAGNVADFTGQDHGRNYFTPKALSDQYFAKGCIHNGLTDAVEEPLDVVNRNPVYEELRNFVDDNFKMQPRAQLIGYEVAGGKSVLYFKRKVTVSAEEFDTWEGLGPSLIAVASGELVESLPYVIVGGNGISYNGTNYADGDTFTATSTRTFTQLDPEVLSYVYRYNGIIATAPKLGQSNEWCCFLTTMCSRHQDETPSSWEPDTYSDTLGFLSNRCHFNSTEINGHIELGTHAYQGSTSALAPILPTGYNFVEQTNGDGAQGSAGAIKFNQSCKIYQPPYEIESTVATMFASQEAVKVTLKTRLTTTDTAPASVSSDRSTWDKTALVNEAWRSDENAIMEYLWAVDHGGLDLNHVDKACSLKPGDGARHYDGSIGEPDGTFRPSDEDYPMGSCLPRWYFVKLVPKVYEDNNSTLEKSQDAPLDVDVFLQMEFYLRAICSGFVDGVTTSALACDNDAPTLYDYSFESLVGDATGNRWLNFLPALLRTDNPIGHGPMPNTKPYAEIFNQFALCVNKLDKVRLELPFGIQIKNATYVDSTPVTLGWTNDGTNNCGSWGWITFSPSNPTTLNNADADWSDVSGLVIGNSSEAQGDPHTCSGGVYPMVVTRGFTQFRITPTSESALALPSTISDMVDSTAIGFLGLKIEKTDSPAAISVSASVDAYGCPVGSGTFWNSGDSTGYRVEYTTIETQTCGLYNAGTIDPGAPPSGDFFVGEDVSGNACTSFSRHAITIYAKGNQIIPFLQVPLA